MTTIYEHTGRYPAEEDVGEVSSWMSLRRGLIFFAFLVVLWSVGRYFVVTMFNWIFDSRKMMSMNEQIVVDPHNNGVVYPVSYWSDMGKRNYQEDTHQERRGKGVKDSCLYGVFDGHGGYRASQFCKEFLLNYVVDDESFVHDPALALKRSFFSGRCRVLSNGQTSLLVRWYHLLGCLYSQQAVVRGQCRRLSGRPYFETVDCHSYVCGSQARSSGRKETHH